MRHFYLDFIFTAIFLTIIIDISCQSKSDFDMMAGNSVKNSIRILI